MPLTISFFVFPIDDDSRWARRSLAQGPSMLLLCVFGQL